ncbi:hypothetical protein E2C01_014727 [Portunus trituberculatus]|uniref:Uncharacterized protein n=1 Tax=Portunus trituberculatus TaxID=210409 RepID=A0A5B7DJK9_PORTR|nr:hypothetical protein [Portunus trituberculatus]
MRRELAGANYCKKEKTQVGLDVDVRMRKTESNTDHTGRKLLGEKENVLDTVTISHTVVVMRQQAFQDSYSSLSLFLLPERRDMLQIFLSTSYKPLNLQNDV